MAHSRSHAIAARAPFSLLRLSAAQRLFGAAGVVMAIWALVGWAMR
ncbi:hypothetical protein [Alsobacter soli]|nr:hypothetical protein [Alsobacter soli]